MAFLFGAFLGLVVGVAVVMAFARFENSRAEQRRELVCVDDPIPPPSLFDFSLRELVWFNSI
jgi:positive regulator of sigma E activity